jgi:hypothetical protein
MSRRPNRGEEAIVTDRRDLLISHPRLKNVVALFKDNECSKQTRGLIRTRSRLLKSVWNRNANDVFLIRPQHFDLAIADVSLTSMTEISAMRDVYSKGPMGKSSHPPMRR